MPDVVEDLPEIVDNWIRLKLVEVDYGQRLISATAYDWVDQRPEVIRLKADEEDPAVIVSQPGVLHQTAFGRRFARAVGVIGGPLKTS